MIVHFKFLSLSVINVSNVPKIEHYIFVATCWCMCILIVTFAHQLLPCTIVELCEEDQTFVDLFCVIKAGQLDTIVVSDDLKCTRLLKIFVGIKPEALMVTAPNHCVFTVCMQFRTFIKFSVDVLTELATPVRSSSSTSQPRNAFEILTTSQKQLQLGDNGLPFHVKVKDKRSYVQWYTSPHEKNGCSLDWQIGAWCAIVEITSRCTVVHRWTPQHHIWQSTKDTWFLCWLQLSRSSQTLVQSCSKLMFSFIAYFKVCWYFIYFIFY